MNILLLGPNRPELTSFIESHHDYISCFEGKLEKNNTLLEQADFLISFGYRHILKQDILEKLPGKAINIHISYLPWNRGADPNLWSFLEDTPKGVSIHRIDKGIDTGDILFQQQISFSEDETLKTSYEKLSKLAIASFIHCWPEIRDGVIAGKPQTEPGSFHKLKDKENYEYLLTEGWDTPVDKLIGKAL